MHFNLSRLMADTWNQILHSDTCALSFECSILNDTILCLNRQFQSYIKHLFNLFENVLQSEIIVEGFISYCRKFFKDLA